MSAVKNVLKCSHIVYMLRFCDVFSHQPWLEAVCFCQFEVRDDLTYYGIFILSKLFHDSEMKGFALIEVLVALFILSAGLFAIANMQLLALRNSEDTYLQSLAAHQLSSLLERLRANQSISARQNELLRWNASNVYLLPQGKGDYYCSGNWCTVHVEWFTRQAYSLSLSGYL